MLRALRAARDVGAVREVGGFVSGLGRVARRKRSGDLLEDHLAAVEPHLGLLLERRRGGYRQVLLGQVCLPGAPAVPYSPKCLEGAFSELRLLDVVGPGLSFGSLGP